MAEIVHTIGHSNHSTQKFIDLLTMHGITAVADVRSHPYSRFNPQFNRENLLNDLKASGLTYAFLGQELGARPNDPSCFRDGKVEYHLLANTELFQKGLDRLVRGANAHNIALMCAEKDPLTCHRAILVCRHLEDRGITIRHILEDGQIECHDAALSRLLDELGLDERDLFRGRDEVIQDAYDQRGREIAYIQPVSTEEHVRGPNG